MTTKSTSERNLPSARVDTSTPLGPAELLFKEIKEALHGGGNSKPWLLPPPINKVECVIPGGTDGIN